MATAALAVTDVQCIDEFPKGRTETVRAELYRYGGKPCAQLRVFATTRDGLKPTTRGLAVSVANLPALRAAVERLVDAARAGGLLPSVADATP